MYKSYTYIYIYIWIIVKSAQTAHCKIENLAKSTSPKHPKKAQGFKVERDATELHMSQSIMLSAACVKDPGRHTTWQ